MNALENRGRNLDAGKEDDFEARGSAVARVAQRVSRLASSPTTRGEP
jgi:hypothetical protein